MDEQYHPDMWLLATQAGLYLFDVLSFKSYLIQLSVHRGPGGESGEVYDTVDIISNRRELSISCKKKNPQKNFPWISKELIVLFSHKVIGALKAASMECWV